jgi:hypothetical protein
MKYEIEYEGIDIVVDIEYEPESPPTAGCGGVPSSWSCDIVSVSLSTQLEDAIIESLMEEYPYG